MSNLIQQNQSCPLLFHAFFFFFVKTRCPHFPQWNQVASHKQRSGVGYRVLVWSLLFNSTFVSLSKLVVFSPNRGWLQWHHFRLTLHQTVCAVVKTSFTSIATVKCYLHIFESAVTIWWCNVSHRGHFSVTWRVK